jgi:hypothetical protein
MNKNVFLLALVICVTSITANAQVLNKNTTFKVGGLGRSVLTSDKLSGELVDGDTISPKKGLGGYTLFDLNMDLTINKIFNANTILRMRNPYGTFYGQDTKFEFRQLQFRGQIGRSLKYEVGDVYVGLTPFTVFNSNEPLDNKFESDVFKARRDILNYENFYVDNKWRLQGLQLFYAVDSVLVFQKIGLNVFAIRTNATNEGTQPDRILAGGRLDVVQSARFKFGVNGVSYTDLAVASSASKLSNNVLSADAMVNIENDMFYVGVGGEVGLSSSAYKDNVANTSSSYSDYFYQPQLKVAVKPAKVALNASYRNVGPQFNSPTAQTQRVNNTYTPNLFPSVNSTTVARQGMLFDRTTEEGSYNRNISQSLGVFLPQYGNITPYGAATPNRTGISVGIATDTSLKNINLEANIDLLTEINGELNPALRKFTGIRGGVLVNVGGLAKLNRLIDISGGIKTEQTTRDGGLAVDFNSTVIDAGLAVETLKKVDLIGGVKLLTAKGNEYLSVRNSVNVVDNYTVYNYDGSEHIYSGGLRFRFAEYASASVVYNTSSVKKNNLVDPNNKPQGNYTYEQLFFSFILKF